MAGYDIPCPQCGRMGGRYVEGCSGGDREYPCQSCSEITETKVHYTTIEHAEALCRGVGGLFGTWTTRAGSHPDAGAGRSCGEGGVKMIDEVAFWLQVNKTGKCWLWTGGRAGSGYERGKGYGVFHQGNLRIRAHRAAWILKNGIINDGLNVLHRCDNTLCVRPSHLFLGTQKDNIVDCSRKGRNGMQVHPELSSLNGAMIKRSRGENNGASKLTQEEVRKIRKMRNLSSWTVARRFSIHPTTVQSIWSGKTWGGPLLHRQTRASPVCRKCSRPLTGHKYTRNRRRICPAKEARNE